MWYILKYLFFGIFEPIRLTYIIAIFIIFNVVSLILFFKPMSYEKLDLGKVTGWEYSVVHEHNIAIRQIDENIKETIIKDFYTWFPKKEKRDGKRRN